MFMDLNWHLDFVVGPVNDGGLEVTRVHKGTSAVKTTHSSTNQGIT